MQQFLQFIMLNNKCFFVTKEVESTAAGGAMFAVGHVILPPIKHQFGLARIDRLWKWRHRYRNLSISVVSSASWFQWDRGRKHRRGSARPYKHLNLILVRVFEAKFNTRTSGAAAAGAENNAKIGYGRLRELYARFRSLAWKLDRKFYNLTRTLALRARLYKRTNLACACTNCHSREVGKDTDC